MKTYVIITNADDCCEILNCLMSREKKLENRKKLNHCEQLELLKLHHQIFSIRKQIEIQNNGQLTFKISEVKK